MGFTAVLNGNLYDITTMSVTIGGTPFTRGVFSELNWSASQEPGKFEGNSIAPVGYTPGHAEGKGSAKLLISYFDDLSDQITGLGYPSVMGVDFDITVSFLVNQFGPTPTNDQRTVNLIGCRINSVNESTSGTDAKQAELEMIIHRVKVNGNTIFAGEDDVTPF